MKGAFAKSLRLLACSGLLLFFAGCGAPRPPVTYPAAEQPRSRVVETSENQGLKGWQKPYEVFGERYHPLRSHEGFVEDGIASWYGKDFHGKKTSNGEIYDMYAMTAAHKTLPLGVFVRVTNKTNGRQAILRVNDRGPFVKGRVIDLSFTAAKELEVVGPGTAPVRVEALGYRATDQAGNVVYQQPRTYDIGSYSVQIGAFTVLENAQRLAEQMRGLEGYSVIHRGTVNGQLFYRVRAGKFESLEAAERAGQRLEQQGFANSFVVAME